MMNCQVSHYIEVYVNRPAKKLPEHDLLILKPYFFESLRLNREFIPLVNLVLCLAQDKHHWKKIIIPVALNEKAVRAMPRSESFCKMRAPA